MVGCSKSHSHSRHLGVSQKRPKGVKQDRFSGKLEEGLSDPTHSLPQTCSGHGYPHRGESRQRSFFGSVQGRPVALRRGLLAWDPCRVPRAPGT